MSCIWDGMDQKHSRCPHLGTQTQFSKPLKQHIQGILVHGVGKCLVEYIMRLVKCVNISIIIRPNYLLFCCIMTTYILRIVISL